MKYLRVRNFEKFQHYKDRSPPWIKLYNDILEDYEFTCLPDASKYHLFAIWLLASRTDNKIPSDEKWISRKIAANSKVDIRLLLSANFLEEFNEENQQLQSVEQDASTPLASSQQLAPRGEESRAKQSRANGREFTPPTLQEVTDYCHERKNSVRPEKWIDFYTSKGWMIGRNKMKDWRAAVRTWEDQPVSQKDDAI